MGVEEGGGVYTVGSQVALCPSANRACVGSAVHDGGKREGGGS